MNNPKWGEKRQCLECGARFYDLKKTKIICPKCDAPFKGEAPPKAKRAIATPEKAKVPEPPAKEQVAESSETAVGETAVGETAVSEEEKTLKALEVEVPEDGEAEDRDKNTFEDVSELGEDEDDMAEVIDGSRKVDDT